MSNDLLQDLFGQMAADGWDGLTVDPKRLEAAQQAMLAQTRAEAAIVGAALETEAGRAFVLWLMKKTLLRPPSAEEQAATTAEDFAIRRAHRDGGNAVMWIILHALQVARGETKEGP